MNRLLSLAVAVSYLAYAYWTGAELLVLLAICGFLAFPLALIWFGHLLEVFPSHIRWLHLRWETPGCIFALLGWIFLLAPAVNILISRIVYR